MHKLLQFKEILGNLPNERIDKENRPLVGWTCSYLPLEILEAAGLQPYRILPRPCSETADSYLDPNFCPFIRATLGSAMDGEYSFLSGMVLLNTCDGMRRLYDAWRYYCPAIPAFFLDVPRVITPFSLAYFREELNRLARQIEKEFRVILSADALTRAIGEANRSRALLKKLISLRGRGDPPLNYGDIMDILAEGWKNPRESFNEALQRLTGHLEGELPQDSRKLKVMVTGSLQEGCALIRLLEELGAEVVGSDLCTGERFVHEVDSSADLWWSLGEAYMNKTPCARMYDTERRAAHIEEEVRRSGAHGLLYISLKFCDPYLYEGPTIRRTLGQMGIPTLFLEGEYTGRVGGAVRTRVQAFLEMLERHAIQRR